VLKCIIPSHRRLQTHTSIPKPKSTTPNSSPLSLGLPQHTPKLPSTLHPSPSPLFTRVTQYCVAPDAHLSLCASNRTPTIVKLHPPSHNANIPRIYTLLFHSHHNFSDFTLKPHTPYTYSQATNTPQEQHYTSNHLISYGQHFHITPLQTQIPPPVPQLQLKRLHHLARQRQNLALRLPTRQKLELRRVFHVSTRAQRRRNRR
jgi:hypothetical protein